MESFRWRPRPRSRKGAPIELYTFGDKDFERLCSEIFEEEPNIDGCDIYGVPGQGQFGIDLIAREADAAHVQVGQCKCRRQFSTKDIKEVSDKFFEHWAERWSARGITRFILFLACEVDETQKQDEIDRQREYFARFAIKYEVWPASRIIKKLRPYSGIVSSYFEPAEYWLVRICGQSLDYPRSLTNAVVYQNEQLSAVLAGAIEATVVNIRQAWQEGRREDARKLLLQAKGNEAALSALPNSLRAKLIRFEAIDLLERGGAVADAERIAERAAELDSSGPGTVQLAAVLRLRHNDPTGALGLLGRETDLDSIHLRASILLGLQRTQEAGPLLAKIDDNTSTAETHRLRALMHLSSEDITSALLEAQKAVELQPRWPSVVFLAGSIGYLTSLAFPPRFLPNIPEPAHWDLVKRDDATLQRLDDAASLFRSLLEGPDLKPVERETVELWQLACLANHPGHQDDGAALCDSIIKHQPTRAEPVAWAIVRNMDVNLDRAEAALRDEINGGGANGDQIVSLVAIYCHHKQWHKAERLIDRHRDTLLAHGGEAMFTHWKAQVLSLNNQFGAAIALIDSSPAREELLSLRAKVVAAHPSTDGLHRDALVELGSLYNNTGKVRYLLDACVIAERIQDWQFISDHAWTILNSLETAEIVRPVASATFSAGRPDICLQLLDASTRLFPGEKLPSDLRGLRIACQQGIGAIPAAVLEAERLVHDEPTLPHLLGLSEVYFSKGDFRRLCIIGRDLLRCPGLTADSALRLSWQTQWEDRHLSRDLWQHAVAAGLSDSAVMPALRLGYALGLDEELAPLTKRMEELGRAGRAGIQLGTIEQLIEHTRHFQKHVAELNKLYTSAQVPIHMVADQVNLSLAEIYHANIERCASSDDLSEQSALLTRYGGKAIIENAHSDADKWRLNLDVTALLLAADLELLPAVESKYRPIRVSRHLIPGLVAMRDHLTANQPQRLAAARQIVGLRDSGRLAITSPNRGPANESSMLPPTLRGEWEDLLKAADACGGFVVEFISIPSSGDFIAISSLPQEIQRRIVNCRTVIEALRTHGPFSDEEYHSTLRRLGSESDAPTFTLPKPEDHLFFHATTVELLSTSGALPYACETFRCHITAEESARLDGELQAAENQQRVSEWVTTLIDRLSRGLEEGTYEIIPGTEQASEEGKHRNRDVACLVSLLGAAPEKNDVLWIDDRWANRHLRGGTTPIVDVLDILRSLRSSAALTDAQYYAKLSRLRAGNVWFYPVDRAEILWHLLRASVGADGVAETVGLKSLRRGLASCLLRSNILLKPTDPQVQAGHFEEGSFVLSFNHAVSEAIAEVWKSEDASNSRIARADWLLRNLYVDIHVLKRLNGVASTPFDAVSLTATRFALLISKVFGMPFSGAGAEKTRDYVRWLVTRVLEGPLRNEPGLAGQTANILKRMFLDVAPKAIRTKRAKALMALLHQYLDLLPDSIRDELNRDPEFASRLKFRSTLVVEIAGYRFERSVFLEAATEGINGRERTISDLPGKAMFLLKGCLDSNSACGFVLERQGDMKGTFEVRDALFGVLKESPSAREELLRRERHLFDMPEAEFAHFVAAVASTADPGRRVLKVEEERAKSGAYYYQELYQALSSKHAFNRSELIPRDAVPLSRYYRIRDIVGNVSVPEAFSAGAADLLASEPLVNVVQRLATLPMPMAENVRERVSSLPRFARRDLIKKLLRIASSPVSQWHIVSLLQLGGDAAETRLARRIARHALLPAAASEFEAYKAVVLWSAQEFRSLAGVSTGMRLAFAWAHAHQIFVLFKKLGASIDWIKDCFEGLTDRVRFGPLEEESKLRADVSHPVHLTREVFLLGGLYYGFSRSESQPLATGITDLFWRIAVRPSEVGPFIALPLLLDARVVIDELRGVLGGDRHQKLVALAPDGERESVQAIVAETTLEKTVIGLATHNHEPAWWSRLYTVLGSSPVPPEHSRQVMDIALGTDFPAIASSDPDKGYLALHIASTYAKHMFDDALRERLSKALVDIASLFGKRGRVDESDTTALTLLDTALNLAQCSAARGRTIDEFSSIVDRMAKAWPFLATVSRPGVQRMCEELPISDTDELWKLNLRFRCRS